MITRFKQRHPTVCLKAYTEWKLKELAEVALIYCFFFFVVIQSILLM